MTRQGVRALVRGWFGLAPEPSHESRAERERRRTERLAADAKRWRQIEAEDAEQRAAARRWEDETLRARLERDRILW